MADTNAVETLVALEPTQVAQQAYDAFMGAEWQIGIGAAIMLLMVVGHRTPVLKWIIAKVPKEQRRWVAMGLGLLTALGFGLSSGLGAAEILKLGFTWGSDSILSWELGGKTIRNGSRVVNERLLKRQIAPPENDRGGGAV